ncbi:cell division protein ZapA [Rheinheimera sp. MMS21-TC3]|uniref:cell division protein ZapA n=1 Tax=Rheinheimera sp. MMS21-TC3 TaxID=3072790 RepID=UPI0028C4A3D0|nr:cell division protein ZapA [Rheinheimera sp. MMS21-TC3]WNO61119.1 cell division protein ZapA [Rheinheimera sp. MMS21-TC3]
MPAKKSVKVSIHNREYTIKVPQGAETLLETLASKLDEQLTELATEAPQFSRDELLVLTALNSLQREDELLQQKQIEQQQLKQLVAMLQQQTF